jgi:hypothetical protein
MPNSESMTSDRSMGRLSLRLAAFLLPVVFLWASLEWMTAKTSTSYSGKRQRLDALSDRIDTLIFGASSAYYGLAPKQLSGTAFNLAAVAQTFYYDDRLLTQVLPRLPRLRRVIVSVQYVSFFSETNDFGEDRRQYVYEQEWGIAPLRFTDRMDIRMWSRIALLGPHFSVLSVRPALNGLARGARPLPTVSDYLAMDDRGWEGKYGGDDPSRLNAAAAARTLSRYRRIMKANFEEENLGFLKHILSLLQAQHIECVLVTLPVWSTFRDGMRADMWDKTQSDIQHLVKIYGVRYLSFLTLPETEEADFLDVDHLNARGAIRFTKILNADLQATASSP